MILAFVRSIAAAKVLAEVEVTGPLMLLLSETLGTLEAHRIFVTNITNKFVEKKSVMWRNNLSCGEISDFYS